MYCKKCGKELPSETKFCIYCGAPVGSPAPSPRQDEEKIQTRKNRKSSAAPVLVLCAIIIVLALLVTGAFVVYKLAKANASDGKTVIAEVEEVSEAEEETAEETAEAATTAAATEASTTAAVTEAAATAAVTEAATEAATTAAYEEPPAINPLVYTTYYVVNCDEFITLRSEPSTSAAALCHIPYGSAVSYVDTSINGFYKIIYNGTTGYGLASYLSTTKPMEDRGYAPAGTHMWASVFNCQEWISLRSAPSTSADRIIAIPLGEVVEVLSTDEPNGFWKVDYNGFTGYALSQYLLPE